MCLRLKTPRAHVANLQYSTKVVPGSNNCGNNIKIIADNAGNVSFISASLGCHF